MAGDRITWTGDTRRVGFVFEFVCDEEPNPGDYKAYDNYESANPGKITELESFYYQNSGAWERNELELTSEQVETLEVLIACVNEWYKKESMLFMAMNALFHTNNLLKEWDQQDEDGESRFIDDVDWWREDAIREMVVSDIFERIGDNLGEESFLLERLSQDYLYDDLLEIFSYWQYYQDSYDLETVNITDVPEDELEAITEFLSSNVLLLDFKNFSDRYHLSR